MSDLERAARALCAEMDWAEWGPIFNPSPEKVEALRKALGLPTKGSV